MISDVDDFFQQIAEIMTEEWPEYASCKDMAEMFSDSEQEGDCKRICDGCAVRLECLNQAVWYSDEGVRGGTNSSEREKIIQRQKRYLKQFRLDVLGG